MSLAALLKFGGGFGLLAAVVAFAATPLAAALARRFDVMDHPDQLLKPHARPTPYLGGLAIALGWVVALLSAMVLWWRPESATPGWQVAASVLLPVLLGGVAFAFLGLADDVSELSPVLRLGLGAIIVAAVMLLSGAGLRLTDALLEPLALPLPETVVRIVSIGLGIIVVLGACNATNLIDGLDGLCAGVSAVISLGFAALAALDLVLHPQSGGHAVRVLLALAMAGATIGFLPHNFQPARIFMGDAGSLLLGFNGGVLILLFAHDGRLAGLLAAVTVFGLPIFDAALAMFRRWRSGKPIFAGDRSHFYDQLVQRGYSVRQTALICYAVSAAYAVLGCVILHFTAWPAIGLFAACVIATAAIAWWTRFTNPAPVVSAAAPNSASSASH